MKKKILALILAAAMVFTLCACEVSSEHTATTTVTTSKTDADGNTTTQTVTNEIGITADQDGIHTKNETTSDVTTSVEGSMAEAFAPKEDWYNVFTAGGEGENEDGDAFYFAYDDPENVSYAMLLITFADGSVMVRNGEVVEDEDYGGVMIWDEEVETGIPFEFVDTEEEGTFGIHFLANDSTVAFEIVDQDTIINDIYNILPNAHPTAAADETEEVEDAG